MENQLLASLESQYRLPNGILDALWAQESGRGKNMLNKSSGATGHFQMMPENFQGTGVDPNNLKQSAEWTAKYAKKAIERFPELPPAEAIAKHHFAGPNTKGWGPKTRKYAEEIQGRMGESPAQLASPVQQSASPVPSQMPQGGQQMQNHMMPPIPEDDPLSLGERMAANPFLQAGLQILGTNNLGGAAQGFQAASKASQEQRQSRTNRRNSHWQNRVGRADNRPASVKEYEYVQNLRNTQGEDAAREYLEMKKVYGNIENAREMETAKQFGKNVRPDTQQYADNLIKLRNFGGRIQDLQGKLVKLHGMTDASSAGVAGLMASIPETDAKAWSSLKQSITSSLALDELKQLKLESPVGASGLGALNEKELEVLITSVANLNQTNDPDEIKENIKKIMGSYINFREQTKQAYQENFAGYNATNRALDPEMQLPFRPKPTLYENFRDNKAEVDQMLATPQGGSPGYGGGGTQQPIAPPPTSIVPSGALQPQANPYGIKRIQ